MRYPETDEDFRTEVCDWLRANDVDPNRIPGSNPGISVADGQLTFRRAVLSELTQTAMVDPLTHELLTEVVTVPLIVEPSADIAEWLRPKCPTCGR